MTLRAKRPWLYSIGVIALVALLGVGTVLVTRDGSEAVPNEPATGGFTVAPGSLEELAAASEVIMLATVMGPATVEQAHFGTSSPLGAERRTYDVSLDIATYELRVDRCVAGTCPASIQFKEGVNWENPPLVPGLQALFFLEPSGAEWGAAGYASHFGREGVLVSRDGTVVAFAPGGGAASRLFAGKSLEAAASALAGARWR